MHIKLLFILITSFVNINLQAQKRVNVDLNFNVYKSIGKKIQKNYLTQDGYLGIIYYEKRPFQNPFVSLTGNISYPVLKKLDIGLQTGLYVIFSELYDLYPLKNHFAIPLQTTFNYELLNTKNYSIGLFSAIGVNFFTIEEVASKYKNALLYNGAIYYKCGKSKFKIGLEKQIDNVKVNLKKLSPYTKEDFLNYKLNRGCSILISYGFQIK